MDVRARTREQKLLGSLLRDRLQRAQAVKISLTFDDGPSEWTGPILDLLAAHDARATFFITGGQIQTATDAAICARVVSDGHQVGNHTMTHPDLTTLDHDEVRKELGCANLMIAATAGLIPDVYRPPYLRLNATVQSAADEMGLRPVGCDIIPGDWSNPVADEISEYVVTSAHDGAIILLHDGRPHGQPGFDHGGSLDSRQHTVDALGSILPRLRDRGFKFVTVSDLA